MRTLLALAALIAGVAVSTSPATAADHRPCVSQVEYQSTPGALRIRGAINLEPLSRRKLEKRWEVEDLGIIDSEYTDRGSTMWVYRACGYSIDEGQVWALSTGRNGVVDVVSRWIKPGATSHGYT